MPKKKEPKEEVVLTEWQKRNLEFLKKKKEQEAEQEKIREKLRVERRIQVKKEDDNDKEEAKSQKSESQTRAEEPKKQKVAQVLSVEEKARKRALPIFFIAGFIFIFSLFLVTPFSKMKRVTVKGLTNTTESNVLKASGIKSSDYFLSLIFKHSTYEQATVANNTWVKKASLTYHFPINFTLTIQEYDVMAYTHTDNGFQPILENGTWANVVTGSQLPEKFLTVNLPDEKSIRQLIKAFSKLDKKLISQIQIVSSADSKTTKDLLLLEMHDGNIVRVPLSELRAKLPYYDKIKRNLTEPSIVDMEVGIYTTNANIEAETASSTEVAPVEEEQAAAQTENTEESTETPTETDEISDTPVSDTAEEATENQ